MADEKPGAGPDKTDRSAYLEEQIQRQKRGESIDVEWVAEELQRVRREQTARLQASQRNMRWLVLAASALLIVMWAQKSGMLDRGGYVMMGLMALIVVTVLALRRGRGSKPGPPPA